MPGPLPPGMLAPESLESFGSRPSDADRPVVRRITFEGNALFATESLKVLMRVKEGRRLDPVDLDADMEMLFRFFENVRVYEDPIADGIGLRFAVSENPLVVELQIFGASEISENEIRGMLQTKVGYPLFPYAIASDSQDIVRAYKEKGYHFANVPEPKIATLPSGGRRVEFFVVEGPKVEVDRIVFRGNVHVTRKDLLEVMQTEEEDFLPFLSDAEFREDVLLEDIVALMGLYRSRGYLDAEVAIDDLRFSDDKARVQIGIAVIEHQLYRVGTVDVEIDRVPPGEPGSPPPEDIAFFTKERLVSMLGLVPGAPYCGEVEVEGRKAIQDAYYCRSYVEAQVRPLLLRPRERDLVVDVVLPVREGAKYRLERLDFVGNELTKDKVLRRESRARPGGAVDRNELDRTTKRLRSLGYFDRVSMRLEDARGPDGQPIPAAKSAVYEVVEGSTTSLNFGVSLSTDGGFGGSVSFTKRNFDIGRPPRTWDEVGSRRMFTGAGQTFNVLLAPSTEALQASFGFVEPHLFDTDFIFRLGAETRLEFWEDYDVGRLGYYVGLGHPIVRRDDDTLGVLANVTWRHGLAEVQEVEASAVPGAHIFHGDNEVRGIEGEISLRATDDLVKPRWAIRAGIQGEIVGGPLGGDIDIYKLSARYQQDWLVFEDEDGKRHRLTASARVGWSKAFDDTPEVPPFERYYLGGQTLRGFSYRGVGPHVTGNPTGGEWMLTAGLEYEIPLVKDLLGIVAFTDTGTLAQSLSDPDAFAWRVAVGFGFRLKLPFFGNAPLAFDFGFPLLYEEEDERTLITFAAGRNF